MRILVNSISAPKVDLHLADEVAELGEIAMGIGARIAHDDEAATPPHHLVDSQILEMAAVGKIDVAAEIVGRTSELAQQGAERTRRIGQIDLPPSVFARAGSHPLAKTNIEQGIRNAVPGELDSHVGLAPAPEIDIAVAS